MKKEKSICYGSMAELRMHIARREGRPPMSLEALNAAFEKVDPGGKEAIRNAVKIEAEALRDQFEQLCKEGKLGEKMKSAIAMIPKFGPVNLRERASTLLLGAIIFALTSPKDREELIEKGGWTEK
jgi:hypothetical protein